MKTLKAPYQPDRFCLGAVMGELRRALWCIRRTARGDRPIGLSAVRLSPCTQAPGLTLPSLVAGWVQP